MLSRYVAKTFCSPPDYRPDTFVVLDQHNGCRVVLRFRSEREARREARRMNREEKHHA
jgi:hypothetical protein